MSMYNLMHGTYPAADWLLAILNLTKGDVGRFRDCFPHVTEDDELRIAIYTRNGGGNREDYAEVFETLAAHPNYISDKDEDHDCTYATIYFSIPEKFKEQVRMLLELGGSRNPEEDFKALVAKLESGDKDDPDVKRAMKAMEPIVTGLKKAFDGTGPNVIEV